MSIDHPLSLYSCRWVWCRSTFTNNADLVHHVINDHVHCSIPIRRRDIPMLRRAEEGSGQSLSLSYSLLAGDSSSSVVQELRQAHISNQEPSSSLPSPPSSSPSSLSPASGPYALPNDPRSRSVHCEEPSESQEQIKNESRPSLLASSAPDFQFCQADAGATTPTFASLRSPLNSPRPLVLPDSPSFSSLVNQPAKRKSAFGASDNHPSKKSIYSRHPLSQALSSASTSSIGSQLSVELQLTQSPEDDADGDVHSDSDHSDDGSSERDTAEPPDPLSSAAPESEQNLYKSELRWDLSQPEASQVPHDSQQSSLTQETDSNQEGMELLTQPPSQFQYEGFPIHHHGPKRPRPNQISLVTPTSSAPLPLNVPVTLASPVFTASTPQKQNWYAAVPKRTRSSLKVTSEDVSTPSPAKPTHMRHTRSTSKSRTFRSGTLQLTPVKAGKSAPEPIAEESDQGSQQSSVDSSQSFENFSYPLLTQAPYQSQSLE